MNYDSNAFLAGLAVGRRLKGWAGANGGLAAGGSGGMEVIIVTEFAYPVFAPTILVDTPEVIPVLSYVED